MCDPSLTVGLPPRLTAATGMDAMTHCIEALLSPQVNPPAEAVACDGIERGIREGNLRRAVQDGSDKDARWHMMMAATEGAMAFSKGLGAVHSMSHACGADQALRLHHGTLNAVLLPTILDFNRDHVGDKYARLNAAMGCEAGADPAEVIRELNAAHRTARGLGRDGCPGRRGSKPCGARREGCLHVHEPPSMLGRGLSEAVRDRACLKPLRGCAPRRGNASLDFALG